MNTHTRIAPFPSAVVTGVEAVDPDRHVFGIALADGIGVTRTCTLDTGDVAVNPRLPRRLPDGLLVVGVDRAHLRRFARDDMGLALDEAALGRRRLLRAPVFGCGARMLTKLADDIGPGAAVRRDAVERMFLSGVVEAFSAGTPPRPGDLTDETWRLVLDHVALNLDRKLMVDDLVDLTTLSPTRFNAVFRDRTGQSPHAYIVAARIARARDLLSTTADTLAAIAARCGFSDHAHLTRAFRAATGTTPSAFRRAARTA